MRLDLIDPRGEGRDTFRVVIETSRGSRNKFSYEPKERAMLLKKVLPEGHVFPFDFGFISRTKGEDGDPLDVLVMMDEPVFAGCIVECRLIGVLRARQQEKRKWIRNDRFLAVAESSLHFQRIRDLRDLAPEVVKQVRHFFVSYNAEVGTRFAPGKMLPASAARRLALAACAGGEVAE